MPVRQRGPGYKRFGTNSDWPDVYSKEQFGFARCVWWTDLARIVIIIPKLDRIRQIVHGGQASLNYSDKRLETVFADK